MKFKSGDILICTGWDDIDIDESYDNKNALEYHGLNRYQTFQVIKVYPNFMGRRETVITFNTGLEKNFGLNEDYFTLYSEYREEQLNKII